MKSFIKKRFPRLYSILRSVRHQATTEYKVLRQIGVRTLLTGRLWRRTPWQEVLPIQAVRRIPLEALTFDSIEELLADLDTAGLSYSAGAQAVYLPPETIAASQFGPLHRFYPESAGIKLVRDPGGVEESHYVSAAGRSSINRSLTADHGRLSLVANLLHSSNLGPRLFDLVELQGANQVWTAYVIEHVVGGPPSVAECEEGLERLRVLEKTGVVQVTLPGGYEHKDFRCPDCNANAFVDRDGRFHYVDFQNFVLADYASYLQKVALEAVQDTHFGPKSLIRGGAFLYQSIPGVKIPSRRSSEDRVLILRQLMEAEGLSVRDRVVLDIGCNIGMMIAEYLKQGARWCHGWDQTRVISHTDRLLPALGCTRFSTTGGNIEQSQNLEDDLPEFLRGSLEGCVISYLSVRLHLGWLQALGQIPWSFMIYESHQGEDRDRIRRDLSELGQLVRFEVAGLGGYKDGLSDERFFALLQRTRDSRPSQ